MVCFIPNRTWTNDKVQLLSLSSPRTITNGVIQGSVLSPHAFHIYMNDISNIIPIRDCDTFTKFKRLITLLLHSKDLHQLLLELPPPMKHYIMNRLISRRNNNITNPIVIVMNIAKLQNTWFILSHSSLIIDHCLMLMTLTCRFRISPMVKETLFLPSVMTCLSITGWQINYYSYGCWPTKTYHNKLKMS